MTDIEQPDFFTPDDQDVEACYMDGIIFISMPSPVDLRRMVMEGLMYDLPSIIIADLEEVERNSTKRKMLVEDEEIRRDLDAIINSLKVPVHADETPKKKATYPNSGHYTPRGRQKKFR